MSVWGLVDDYTGHTGQVLGVIGELGVPFVLKRLKYNKFSDLPNFMIGDNLHYLKSQARASIAPPWPSLVIAAGRRTLPTLRYIKKHSPKTIVVYSGWPDRPEGLDLIAVPEHDHPPHRDNVITTLAPLHAVTPETLATAAMAWTPQFANLPRPWIALCIGGKTKRGDYRPADWTQLMQQAQRLAGPGSLLVTTSRRTNPESLHLISTLLTGPHLFHRWDMDKENPYLGILGAADAVIVTGDSLSMCAEACVTHKPVFIFTSPQVVPKKHQRLHQELFTRNIARPLDASASLHWQPASPLDDVSRVAAEIHKRFPHCLA